MAFPTSPSNNQVHKETNGHTYVYDSTLGTWDRISDVTAIEELYKHHALTTAGFQIPILSHRYLRTSGGSQTIYSTWKVHTFYQSDLFIVHEQIDAKVLIVGPGGSGGFQAQTAWGGGGGGGGAVLWRASYVIAPGVYPIEIGKGGYMTTSNKAAATSTNYDGWPTRAFEVTAIQGGGGSMTAGANGHVGANVGGGGYSASVKPATISSIPNWTVYGGFTGGIGRNGHNHPGGGGGGANQNGATPANYDDHAGYGGDGKIINYMGPHGESYYWGAGGGGSCVRYESGPAGKQGGNGGIGGGGGGSSVQGAGGFGGSGGINGGQEGFGNLNMDSNANVLHGGGDAGPNTGSGGGSPGGLGADGIVMIKFTA